MKLELPFIVENKPLDEVETFTYLGSIVNQQGGTVADVKARISKARTAFNQLSKIWKASNISLRTKLRLFNSNVKSVLLYGCETWKTTQTIIKRLQTFINRCLRNILKIKWQDRIRNEDLYSRTGQKDIITEIGLRRWRWIGHTLRKPCGNITRQALQWNPQGTRTKGRPRETWKRSMDRDMQERGMNWNELKKKAQDRDQWRLPVRGLSPDKGDGQ